jgi:Subtilisin-like serine proteases
MKNIILIICITLIFSSCRSLFYETNISKGNKLTIVSKPDSSVYRFGKLDSLQTYKEGSARNWDRDLRCRDISGLDLRNNLNELLHSDFDSKTRWPKSLPVGFDPDSIMGIGKNPGLHIRNLHQMGITGKGVGIAIIDQSLLIDHCEYKNQLKMYEEIHSLKGGKAAMHGAAVASIAVGKTVGVAPEAELYYISSQLGSMWANIKYKLFNKGNVNPKWCAKSIYRILEINKTLPSDKKIRVISISFGSDKKSFLKAIAKASNEGVFVISSSLSRTHNLRFHGLGKECLTNPDDVNSYFPGSWWSKSFYDSPDNFRIDSTLMVPMDSRCTASQSGKNSYVFYSTGGWSWSIPYIAGLYVLACQVNPGVTPQEFWKKALETGDTIELDKNGKKYKFGKIVNPVKLMENLKKI